MADTPTKTQTAPLSDDLTVKATMWDPELTYYRDGTRVLRRGIAKPTHGTAVGITLDAIPYQFQVVKWDDGTETNTAPHVLVKVHEQHLWQPCPACGYPLAIVEGALQAPGGLETRPAGNGRTWYTPHDEECVWRTLHPTKEAGTA